MTVLRTIRLGVIALVLGTFAAGAVVAVDLPRPISGLVLDPAGRGLAKVEVFLVPDPARGLAAAKARTDSDGRFLLPNVLPGVYRVAAVKSGYGIFLDRINTGLRSSLDVVLHPLPRPDELSAATIADDASWALRVPHRSVWNDVAHVPLARPESYGERPGANDGVALATLVDGRVDQWVSLAAPRIGVWSGGLQGAETRMALAGVVGERTRILFDGSRSTLRNDAPIDEASAVSASRDAAAFNVGVRHQTSPEASLDVRAYWSEHDFETAVAADDGRRRAANVWGYDASWTQQLDPGSTLAVRMDYESATVGGGFDPASAEQDAAALGAVTHRAIGANGTYETLPGYGHVVRVAFGARFADRSAPGALMPIAYGSPAAWSDGDGWDLQIRAEDSWTVRGPLSVIYGLGYRHRIVGEDEVALVVPAVGSAWSTGRGSIRGVVTYHDETVRARNPGSLLAERADRDGIGYEVSAEALLPLALTVRASASYAPARFEPTDPGGSLRDGRAIYLSSSESAVRERVAGLTYEADSVHLFLEWANGRVSGESTAVLPYDLAFQLLAPTSLTYRAGRVGVRVPRSGTRVQFEHRRIVDRPDEVGAWGSARSQEQYELRLVQDLVRSSPGVSWRLLVSLEAAELDAAAVAYASALQGERLPGSHRQVNTGVSVAF